MTDLHDILNWRRWDAEITLSGLPSEAQLGELARLGVRHVINLARHGQEGALADEAASVAAEGMSYLNIPVAFQDPREADFAAFCDAIAQLEGQKVHVHCMYNARVTAFFYRYAKEGRGGDVAEAFALMESVWRPGGVWARFIGDDVSVELPHRFAGEDY